MHDHLAQRLHREAHASRPAPSPALLHHVRDALAAEPAGQADAPRPRLPWSGWPLLPACAVVVLAIVTIVVTRSPSAPTAGRDTAPDAGVASVPAAVAPPIEELVADLRTELQDMAAALIGLPEWNEAIDLDASLAFMAEPSAERP